MSHTLRDALAVDVHCEHDLTVELRTQERGGDVVATWPLTNDVFDLVDEACSNGFLAGALPLDGETFSAVVAPAFAPAPWVASLRIEVTAHGTAPFAQVFHAGRWSRRALAAEPQGDGRKLHACLLAQRRRTAQQDVRTFRSPPFVDSSLDAFGVRALGAGSVVADRPVLVCARAVDEIVRETREAGPVEIGGSMLGVLLRLSAPLPGTTTPFVTLLTACLRDPRHHGSAARLQFDPQALAEAAALADLRGRGERVVTAFHSHGWGRDCGRCNESAQCALPSADHVSLDDYQVLESLFPSKTSLLPIAGRRLGAPAAQPVLAVHAWRGGCVQPIAWQAYAD